MEDFRDSPLCPICNATVSRSENFEEHVNLCLDEKALEDDRTLAEELSKQEQTPTHYDDVQVKHDEWLAKSLSREKRLFHSLSPFEGGNSSRYHLHIINQAVALLKTARMKKRSFPFLVISTIYSFQQLNGNGTFLTTTLPFLELIQITVRGGTSFLCMY